jgi:hypothetical protein
VIGRRLVALAGVLGIVLAALVLPAAAQTAPPPTVRIFDLSPKCAPAGRIPVYVAGSANRTSVALAVFSPTGQQIAQSGATVTNGGWAAEFAFSATTTGSYEVRATVSTAVASGYIHVPCTAPALEFDPACSSPGTTQLRVTGRWFQPFSNGYVDFNNDGSEELGRIPVDNRGTFSGVLAVTHSSSSRDVRGRDLDQNVAIAAWAPCPPDPTTTAPTTTTSTTAPPDDGPIPTTTTRPTVPGSIVTTTTTTIPPPTPGATLVLDPPLGPTGFVTGAVGTGFPPGPVELTWSGGVGTTMTIAGPDGTFSTRVLVLPGDRLGPRALVATGGGTSTFAAFLVVPSTVQPSGSDVLQINRIRRFNNR